MIRGGHHRAPAGFLHSRGDVGRIGGNYDRAEFGFLRTPHDVNDHRFAGDVGERLAGQSGRGHAGGDQNEDVSHRSTSTRVPP